MTIGRRKRSRNVWIKVLLLVIISGIVISSLPRFTRPSEQPPIPDIASTSISHDQKHPDCDAVDPLVTPKHLFRSFFSVFNDSLWLARPTSNSPSFQDLHNLLFGATAPNLYASWPNYFNKTVDSTYPHTSLSQALLTRILRQADIPVTFVIEVGSFMGKSATNIGKALLQNTPTSTFVLLCIDTWLGGLEHWDNANLRRMMGIAYGRPIVYEQFLANIIANNLTNYVIPYSTTSLLGARFLLDKKLSPQVIYLDSAHLQGETYVELELYWSLLQAGGLLIGDDWSWKSVGCDVLRFIASNKLNVTILSNTWFVKKERPL